MIRSIKCSNINVYRRQLFFTLTAPVDMFGLGIKRKYKNAHMVFNKKNYWHHCLTHFCFLCAQRTLE